MEQSDNNVLQRKEKSVRPRITRKCLVMILEVYFKYSLETNDKNLDLELTQMLFFNKWEGKWICNDLESPEQIPGDSRPCSKPINSRTTSCSRLSNFFTIMKTFMKELNDIATTIGALMTFLTCGWFNDYCQIVNENKSLYLDSVGTLINPTGHQRKRTSSCHTLKMSREKRRHV